MFRATTGSFIGFTDQQSLYLGAKGRASLGLMVDNVERVKVSVYRIFENNLLHYLRNGQQYNYHEIEGHWVDFYGWLADEGYGDIVFEKVMDVGALPTHGEQRLLPLEVDALLNGAKLIIDKVYDSIGFNKIEDETLRQLVVARLCQPMSKMATVEYLKSHFDEDVSLNKIYRLS